MSAERGENMWRRVRGLGFGADYNPEQWDEDVQLEDVRLMRHAGVTMVSLGIFAWATVEPRPGEFHAEWLDRVMDRLAEGGVAVSLATMTASPPAWLAARHPETLPVREDGVRLWPGGRQHYCPSSPIYREHAARLVERLAARYAGHPALASWHIGNEYGCHVSRCYCDVSATDFRRWLRKRYGDIDALNDAWSTSFWSQRYADWDHVLPPRSAPTFANPAQRVDFARFSSDALLDCFLMERDILARVTPEVPVTTNLLSVWEPVDFFRWAPHQDFISHDSYPDPADPHSHIEAGFNYDLMRSLGHGRPWALMEQAPSAVNWRVRNSPKPPGSMRLGSWQAIAQGADAVLYFQWRASRGGAEKYHSAVVPHGGTDTRVFREVSELGQELAGCADLVGSRSRSEVALVMDWSSWWGLELDSHPSGDVRQLEANMSHYEPLFRANVARDITHPGADLSGYRLVVVPNLYLVSAEDARNLVEYVRGGGHLVMSFFSGIVDPCDRVYLGGYPAPFREMLGLRIDEFWPLQQGASIDVTLPGLVEGEVRGTVWSEQIVTEGAEAVGAFGSGELAGQPAVTRHQFGEGVAYYVATRLDATAMAALLARACEEAGVTATLPALPDGVQVTERHTAEGVSYLTLLNHSATAVEVPLPQPMASLVPADSRPADTVWLAPRGVAVLRRDQV